MATRHKLRVITLTLALLILLCAAQQTQAIDSTWLCSSGHYSNTTCWHPVLNNMPPCNSDPFYFDVIIPAGTGTITMDLSSCQVNSLSLGGGRTFLVPAGNSYSVLGLATLYGIVKGDGGVFLAPDAEFPGSAARVEARNGASVEIGAPTYSSTGIPDSKDLIVASDPKTKLILSSLSSINAGFDSIKSSEEIHTISVSSGAFLGLSSLKTITTPVDAEDYLDLFVSGIGSSVDLSSFKTIESAGSGYALLRVADGATVSLPSLEDVSQTFLDVANKAELHADGQHQVTYSSVGYRDSRVLMNVSGDDTILDLLAIQGINAAFDSVSSVSQAHTINVSQGGSLDLSGVRTTTAPCDREDYLDIVVSGKKSSLDLSSLASVLNAGLGYTQFVLSDDVAVSLPSLEDVRQTCFDLSRGARLYANGQSPVSYSSAGYAYDLALMRAVDPNTVLDLSAIFSVNAGFNSGSSAAQIHSITASDGGRIDLSGVETFTAPFDGEDHLDISVSGATSSLDLSSLKTVGIAGFGWARFLVSDGASLSLPKLEDLGHVSFDLSGGAQLFADGPEPASYSSTAMSGSSTLMKVVGPNTLLDLSCVSEIDAGFNSGSFAEQIHTISVTDRGYIDLSNVETIKVPNDDEDTIKVYAQGGSSIDLSSLTTITGWSRSGSAYFEIGGGSELAVGDLQVSATMSISLSGDATLLAKSLNATKSTSITLGSPSATIVMAGDLDMGRVITVSNDGNGSLRLGGDFTYAHTDESQLRLAGSDVYFTGDGPQELEVAGYDIRVYTDIVELDPPDNFGYGQMVVGEPNKPTTVVLVDHIDNANWPGLFGDPDEALYLFGKDGRDGLRILGGSTLFMNGLPVYAMLGNMERPTDLRTLFEDGQEKIPFDEGWICLGAPACDDPGNLIRNGCFEMGVDPPMAEEPVRILPDASSALDGWDVAENTVDWTHETVWPAAEGERFVVVSSDLGAGAVSQTIPTVPGELYRVYFDVAAIPSAGTTEQLTVSAAGDSETFTFQAGAQMSWIKKTWRFTAQDESTTLTFAGTNADPNVLSGIAIDNVVIPVDNCALTVEATMGGSVTVTDSDAPTFVGPGETSNLFYDCGQPLGLLAEAEEGYHFVHWTGSAVDDGSVVDPNSASTEMFLDKNETLTGVFEADAFYILTLDVTAGGSVTVNDGVSVDTVSGPNRFSRDYPVGQELVLTAESDADYHFVGWTGPGGETSTELTLVLYLDQDTSVTAEFETNIIWEELLDNDPGWPMTGQWEFGVPTGQRCGAHGNEDPVAGFTGRNVIGVNLDGCYDLTVGGPYSVVAGPIDLSGCMDVELRFARWLNADWPEYVTSVLAFSVDGATWNLLWENAERNEVTDTEWVLIRQPLGSLVDDQPAVYLRWSYEVVQERAYAYTGWNIDDIQLLGRRQ